ncbi:hypothetical protein Zmor_026169 [Zophobas morio]|uniref:Uncharacterized protein n=1 Tax=Zophobas morio TaxID=2755281 RepID=A0AA38HTM1_9CUCU|nr:hypothetical protein Zmor_026169 [Zophobas morio]
MHCLVKVIYLFAILASFDCEDDMNYYKGYNSNHYSFLMHPRKHFTLDYVKVSTIGEGTISDIPNMESLMFDGIRIDKIEPGAFPNLPRLKSLRIMECYISRINAGVFNNLNITELHITGNKRPLRFAAGAFDNMTSLQKLRQDRIQLSIWDPHWFVNTPQLKHIYAYENHLTEIPEDAFQNLNSDNEIIIFFPFNQIRKVHNYAFRGIKKIKLLSLQHNRLEEFSGYILKNRIC